MRSRLKLICIGFALLTTAHVTFADSPLIGRASVVDGDTIDIHGERVRFNGIDAPETRQLCQASSGEDYRCGQTAALALADFLAASSPTRCEFIERDRYKRFVGDCYRADGSSVAHWMVRNGHALDWRRYSKGAYEADQAAARKAKAGIWQGQFINPWDWRKL